MILLSLLKAAETGENFWLIFGSGILVLCIVQCIQDLYLTPRIMGKAMGLNPAIILLSFGPLTTRASLQENGLLP